VTKWYFRVQPFATPGTAIGAGHIGLGPGLVDEDEACGIKSVLVFTPLCSPPRDCGAILLAGEQTFLNDSPSPWRNSHSAP